MFNVIYPDKRLSLFLTLLVIVISGNPAMKVLGDQAVYVITLFIFIAYSLYYKIKWLHLDVIVLGLFGALMVIHLFEFGAIAIIASLGFFIKLLISLLAIRLIPDFRLHYTSIMYALACMSLIFYIPTQLGIDLASLLSPLSVEDSVRTVTLIHNFHYSYDAYRNCGMFWEPGAFAGYLVIGLLFKVWNEEGFVMDRKGLVMLAALLTTQSTTGYAAFFVLSLYVIYNAGWTSKKMLKVALPPLLSFVFCVMVYIGYVNIPFLGEKVRTQFDAAASGETSSKIQRYGNILYDIDFIQDRPFIGWSSNPETRFYVDPELATLIAGQGNGFTGFIVRFGLVGFLGYLLFFSWSVYRITVSYLAVGFSVVIASTLLMGEQYLGYPLFLTFMFMRNFNSTDFEVCEKTSGAIKKEISK